MTSVVAVAFAPTVQSLPGLTFLPSSSATSLWIEKLAVSGEFEIVQILALPGATPGEDQAAALGVSADGRFLYAGIRGADRIAVIALDDDGLRAVDSVPSGGRWPRHLLVDGELLHVGNQLSNEVATFRIGDDGIPVPHATTATPSPTCLIRDVTGG